jgi:hypothetical protein
LSGSVGVKVLEHESKSITSQVVPYQVADAEVANDQNPTLKADEPRVIRIVPFKRGRHLVGFFKVKRLVGFAGFDKADLTHSYTTRLSIDRQHCV